jgi:2'-5' RNA ligase
MHGVVSLLSAPFSGETLRAWNTLERKHGLRGIRMTPYPHFSWLIATEAPQAGLRQALAEVAAETRPLVVRAGGIGIFPGPNPVIYLSVVKTEAMARLHQRLWERLEPLLAGRSPLYAPGNWMPHISMAYGDVSVDNIGAAVADLSAIPRWEMIVDHFAFIEEPDGATGRLAFEVKVGG